jgi:hypothetical protein
MNNLLVALALLIAIAAALGPGRALARDDGAAGTDRHEVPEFVLKRTELAADGRRDAC